MPTEATTSDKSVQCTAGTDDDRERHLLGLVSAGDRAAITQLYRAYHGRLFKFVFRLTNSYSAAEELVNDVMLLVWRKADSFRGDSKVSTWIFGIAYRMALKRMSRTKMHLAPLGDSDEPTVNELSQETEDWIESGLRALSPAHQLTVVLVFYVGLSYEETAIATDCPVNTVKTRMFHARKKLREALVQNTGETLEESK